MKKQKNLGVNAILNGINTATNIIFPLISFPYATRVLGVTRIGEYNFSTSVISYFSLLASFGISTYAVREGTKYRKDRSQIDSFASQMFSINLWTTILSLILLLVLTCVSSTLSRYAILIAINSLTLVSNLIGIQWIYVIYENYAYITFRSIVLRSISICLLFIFVKSPEDYIVYALIHVFSNVIVGIMNNVYSRKFCKIHLTFDTELRKHFYPLFFLFVSNAATTIYVSSDTTMLGFLCNDYDVGIYSTASKIYDIIKQMLASMLVVSVPRLSLYYGTGELNKFRDTLSKIFNITILLALPAISGLVSLSREVVLLVAGSEYIDSVSPLRILTFALLFCLVGWIYNQCVLLPANKEKIILVSSVVSALLNIVLNFILIPIFKSSAAALTTCVAEICQMIICVWGGRKEGKLNSGWIYNIVSSGIGSLFIAVECCWIKSLNLSTLWTLGTAIPLAVVSYGVLLIVLRNKTALEYFKIAKAKICSRRNKN